MEACFSNRGQMDYPDLSPDNKISERENLEEKLCGGVL